MLSVINLERFQTKNGNKLSGEITPLWKDYAIPMTARYVYFTTIFPNTSKGAYQHTKRRGLLCVVSGKLKFIYKKNNKYLEIDIDGDRRPKMIDIPSNTQYLIKGMGEKPSLIINICDYAWREGDNETLKPDFSDY